MRVELNSTYPSHIVPPFPQILKHSHCDHALDEIREKLKELTVTYRPETIAIGRGTQRIPFWALTRFPDLLGTPMGTNFFLTHQLVPKLTELEPLSPFSRGSQVAL